ALALLASLQLVVAFAGSRIPGLRKAVTARPTLLLREGVVDREALREQRLTMSELRQAGRSSGRGSLEDVAAVVLESDGTLSVIGADQFGNGSALEDLSDS